MRIERFEDILARQMAKDLSVLIYRLFEHSKDFGFKDQIKKAVVAIMKNIAEVFERKGNKEFACFLSSQRLMS
jgi:four helix bundle protein